MAKKAEETKEKKETKATEKAAAKPKKTAKKAVNEVNAYAKYVRVSPIKLKRVANVVRGETAEEAMITLSRLPHKGAELIQKVIKSAVANATHNHDVKNSQNWIVSKLLIGEGPTMKRYQPKGRGRMYQILKRSSHITVGITPTKGAK